MNLLDKIIFIADHIEPGRTKGTKLDLARIMAYKNPDLAVIMLLENTIEYLQSKNSMIDSTTLKTHKYYKSRITQAY